MDENIVFLLFHSLSGLGTVLLGSLVFIIGSVLVFGLVTCLNDYRDMFGEWVREKSIAYYGRKENISLFAKLFVIEIF